MEYNTSIVPFIAVVVIVLGLASNHGAVAVSMSDKYGAISQSENRNEFLSNCLLNDGAEGDIQWFEPMGCSETETIQSINAPSPSINEPENENIILLDAISDNDIYVDRLGYTLEDPDQVGWD